MAADEVFTSSNGKLPHLPREITKNILEHLDMGNKRNVDIATDSGYRQGIKRDAVLRNRKQATAAIPAPPQGTAEIAPPRPPGSSAADALGGRTRRRRRHGKRKTRKTRKGRNSRKRRHTKRR